MIENIIKKILQKYIFKRKVLIDIIKINFIFFLLIILFILLANFIIIFFVDINN